ncbi:MAG TPA: hypothetical protein VIX35_05760, partial [Vicinamibacterales bacterium]
MNESLCFGGRPVRWFGLGDDTINSGIAALQAAITQFGGPGITNPGGAVEGLHEAGNAAVGSLGPAIDALSGGSDDVKKITGWAWTQNSKLSLVPRDSTATQADVDSAKGMVNQMIAWYQQAARLATSKPPTAPPPATRTQSATPPPAARTPSAAPPPSASPPTPPPDDTAMSPWAIAGIAVGAVV